jgi:hypothetical protein
MYKKGVGTWWRRNLSGTVSVTWRSVPGGCRRRARLVLTVVPVEPGRCWLFLFGRKREGWKESGMAGVPSQREGTGQEEKEKAGWPGFPRNGKERARKKRRNRDGRGSLAMGRNGPGRKGESGMAGVPSPWEGTGQEKRRKRDGRASLAMGRNGPGGKRAGCQQGPKRSRSRWLVRKRDCKRNWSRNRNELCRLGAVLLLPRPRHGGTAHGRRLAAGAVGELGSARSPGIVGRKKHGFRDGFGERG